MVQDAGWRRRTAFGVEAARRIEPCQHARELETSNNLAHWFSM